MSRYIFGQSIPFYHFISLFFPLRFKKFFGTTKTGRIVDVGKGEVSRTIKRMFTYYFILICLVSPKLFQHVAFCFF